MRSNLDFSSQWLNNVLRGNAWFIEWFVWTFGGFESTWPLNPVDQLILARKNAELGREFPEVENKDYDNKTLTKNEKAWEEILQKFNPQNPNGIKRGMNQIQWWWRRLKLQFMPRRARFATPWMEENRWRESAYLPKSSV